MNTNYDTLGLDLEKMVGFDYDHYDPQRLPKLTSDEERLWYSKFYYKGRTEVAPDISDLVKPGNIMDSSKAILPGNVDALMEPGHIDGDLGYCLLSNGAGYASLICELPKINLEMYKWYRKLRFVNNLAYKIWYPGSHISELNGLTVEDVGFGVETMNPKPGFDYKMLGFSCHPREKDPNFIGLIGGNTWSHNEIYQGVKDRAMLLFHYIREMPNGGMEFRTHLYVGLHAIDGEAVVIQNIDPVICLEVTRRMASHCIYERSTLNSFLPELYEKMKDEYLPEPESETMSLAMKE